MRWPYVVLVVLAIIFAWFLDSPYLHTCLSDGHVIAATPLSGGPLESGKCTCFKLELEMPNAGEHCFAFFRPGDGDCREDYRAEVAASAMGELVGISKVPKSIEKAVHVSILEDSILAMPTSSHKDRLKRGIQNLKANWTDAEGMIMGAAVEWVEGPLVDARGSIAGSEFATLQLFDFLIDNRDRWSGNNLLRSESKGIIFLDNGESFRVRPQRTKNYWSLIPCDDGEKPPSDVPWQTNVDEWLEIYHKTAYDVHLGSWAGGSYEKSKIVSAFSKELLTCLENMLECDFSVEWSPGHNISSILIQHLHENGQIHTAEWFQETCIGRLRATLLDMRMEKLHRHVHEQMN